MHGHELLGVTILRQLAFATFLVLQFAANSQCYVLGHSGYATGSQNPHDETPKPLSANIALPIGLSDDQDRSSNARPS